MSELIIRNRQRHRALNLRLFRLVTQTALHHIFPGLDYAIGIHLVGPRSMAQMNEGYLGHEGPTDVITFDHADDRNQVYGEIYICITVAVEQAQQFGVPWTQELVRYMVHGLLHLQGFDDKTSVSRRVMKREENRVVRKLGRFHSLSALNSRSKLQP